MKEQISVIIPIYNVEKISVGLCRICFKANVHGFGDYFGG